MIINFNFPDRHNTLKQALELRTKNDLRDVVLLFGIRYQASKEDIIAQLLERFEGPGLQLILENMDTVALSILRECAYNHDGMFKLNRFVAKYGNAVLASATAQPGSREDNSQKILALFFLDNRMIEDLRIRVRELLEPPLKDCMVGFIDVPEYVTPLPYSDDEDASSRYKTPLNVCNTESVAPRELVAMLRLIDTGKIAVTASSKRVTSKGDGAIRNVLCKGDFEEPGQAGSVNADIRAFAWPVILQSAGLANIVANKFVLSKKGRAALLRPPHEVLRELWFSWVEKGIIDEFHRIERIKGHTRKRQSCLTPVKERRACLESVFKACPVGKWVPVDEMFRYIQAEKDEFTVTSNPWNLYISQPYYGGSAYLGEYDWCVIQGRYVMALLWEYASTLGLFDIAHIPPEGARDDYLDRWGDDDLGCLSRYDGLMFVRLTPLGAYCLGLKESYEPPPIEAKNLFTILPNMDIVVHHIEALSAGDVSFLLRIAEQTGDHTWALTKQQILQALEEGISEDEITAFLQACSLSPVPDNVLRFLDDIFNQAFCVSCEGSAEVFVANNEQVALIIAHDTKTKSRCFYAGNNRLIVPKRHVTAFRNALRKMGYIPRNSGEDSHGT